MADCNEPSAGMCKMNPIVYHIAGGGSFFTGVLLMLVAAGLMLLPQRLWKRLGGFSFCIGVIAVSVSSTPLPYWLLAVLIAITVGWTAFARIEKWGIWITVLFAATWISASIWEATYWITPRITPVDSREVTIVGDSITAGMGGRGEVTWPTLLAQQHSVFVDDQSGSGFTTAQALARAEFEGVKAPLVLVEIGGNDMLGGHSAREFYRDLDALLALLAQNGRQVVMLELPLLPFYGNYGRAQRLLARKHDVTLVPKRVFLDIIAPKEATVDSLHLTPRGHQAMADAMWEVLSPALERK